MQTRQYILNWRRYTSFFELWTRRTNVHLLLYVIGDAGMPCYIGSVGGKGGQRGLAARYQKQYVERAQVMFKRRAAVAPAYAATLGSPRKPSDILLIERFIQCAFCNAGRSDSSERLARFRPPRHCPKGLSVTNRGQRPEFLPWKMVSR